MIIEVKNLYRNFFSAKKKSGFKGSLAHLFKPQVLTYQALKSIQFDIQEGEFVGLIGSNGAGKTTLLKILSGLIPPSSGSARILGEDPFQRSLSFRKSISLVMGQKAQLWWDLPAEDAFELLQAIYGVPRSLYLARKTELSELLGVSQHLHTQIRRLSLGERMKMELIGALLHWPRIVFLDEPTIGLDVIAAKKLREFLQWFNRNQKVTMILTSHNTLDIETLCDRVMILKLGELIYDGLSKKLVEKMPKILRFQLKQDPSVQQLCELLNLPSNQVQRLQPSEYEVSVSQKSAASCLQLILSRFEANDIHFSVAGLDEVIQQIFLGQSGGLV